MYDTVSAGAAFGQSSYNLYNGNFRAADTLGFLPGIGFAGGYFNRRLLSANSGLSRNISGLTAQQDDRLEQKLLSNPGARQVRAFGSRTKGTSSKLSDLGIALMGNIDELDPEALSIIVDAQNLAKQYGIGTGKGYRPLDITTATSVRALNKAFHTNPDFNPA